LRDIRISHPTETYTEYPINSHVLESGDVMARAKLRSLEICESLNYIKKLLALLDNSPKRMVETASIKLKPNSMVVSLTEGWRGEICHTAITNNSGEIIRYKVKDPSLHNWFALALAVRDNDISDFPICNKSFDLSYCGHDL
jgi:Ni,Fe-hydrogenase III large subunit